MPRYIFTQKIRDAIVQGIRDCGDQIFLTSQQLVPVDKGHLKKSGRTKRIYNGIQIAYRTPYAAAVEFGFPTHREKVKAHGVRAHYRKYHHIRSILTSKGRITHHWVKQTSTGHHTLRPIDIKIRMKNKIYVAAHTRGPFIRKAVQGRVGRFYLRHAVDNVYPDLYMYIQNRL